MRISKAQITILWLLLLSQGVFAQEQVSQQANSQKTKLTCSQPETERNSLLEEAEKSGFQLRHLMFDGNENISDRLLRRRIFINEGDLFTKPLLEDSLKNLSKVRIIEKVSLNNVVIKLDRQNKTVDAVICVTDKREQKQSKTTATETEIRTFYDEYADDLRAHRREAIANRYDPRGVYLLGNGQKSLKSFAAVKERYLTRWTGPKSFAWKDLSIEVLSPTTAVVIGRFDWQGETGETLNFSYTGVLIKHSGKWRIRVEDESAAPVKPSTQ